MFAIYEMNDNFAPNRSQHDHAAELGKESHAPNGTVVRQHAGSRRDYIFNLHNDVECNPGYEEISIFLAMLKSRVKRNGKKDEKSKQKEFDSRQTADKLVNIVKDINKSGVDKFITSMASANAISPRDILAKAKSNFKSIVHQYAALMALKEELSQKLSSQSRATSADPANLDYYKQMYDAAETARADLLGNNFTEIVSGINVSSAIGDDSVHLQLGSLGALRDHYSAFLIHFSGANELFDFILALIEKEDMNGQVQPVKSAQRVLKAELNMRSPDVKQKFVEYVHFFLDAITADMHAQFSSLSKQQLSNLSKDIYSCQFFLTIFDKIDNKMTSFLQRNYDLPSLPKGNSDAANGFSINVLKDVMKTIRNNSHSESMMRKLMTSLKVKGNEEERNFLAEYSMVIRAVPQPLLPNKGRMVVLTTISNLINKINKDFTPSKDGGSILG